MPFARFVFSQVLSKFSPLISKGKVPVADRGHVADLKKNHFYMILCIFMVTFKVCKLACFFKVLACKVLCRAFGY